MNNRQWKDAMNLFHNRQKCLDKPEGRLDRHGRWIPYMAEMCVCCSSVDYPTVDDPNTMLDHCRTKSHCFQLVAKRERIIKYAERGWVKLN